MNELDLCAVPDAPAAAREGTQESQDWLGLSPRLEHFRVGVVLEALEVMDLPPCAGPTLRGAFGRRLREASCQRNGAECGPCDLAASCAYGALFETPAELHPLRSVRGFGAPPHPQVLRWTGPMGGVRPRGSLMPLELLGTRAALTFLPVSLAALDAMAREGLGKARSRARIVSVLDLGERPARRLIGLEDRPRLRAFAPEGPLDPQARALDLVTVTPLRLHRRGKLIRVPSFLDVVVACQRRSRLLEHFHGTDPAEARDRGSSENDGLAPPLPGALLELARGVKVEVLRERTMRVQRHSTRSGEQSFEGLSGRLRLTGTLSPFLPLLEFGSRFGIGKGTSFGFGHYLLQEPRTSSASHTSTRNSAR